MNTKLQVLRAALSVVALVVVGFVALIGIQFATSIHMVLNPPLGIFLVAVVLTGLVALYIISKFFSLLRLIAMGQTFTQASVVVFRRIRIATLVAAITTLGSLPAMYMWADGDDAPGLMLIGLGVAFIPFAIYAAFAVVEQVLRNAVQSQQHPVHN